MPDYQSVPILTKFPTDNFLLFCSQPSANVRFSVTLISLKKKKTLLFKLSLAQSEVFSENM